MWQAWCAQGNRWRIVVGPMGDRLQGLDAVQVESSLRLAGVRRKERVRIWEGLRVMEKAALAAMYGNGNA